MPLYVKLVPSMFVICSYTIANALHGHKFCHSTQRIQLLNRSQWLSLAIVFTLHSVDRWSLWNHCFVIILLLEFISKMTQNVYFKLHWIKTASTSMHQFGWCILSATTLLILAEKFKIDLFYQHVEIFSRQILQQSISIFSLLLNLAHGFCNKPFNAHFFAPQHQYVYL